MSSGAECDCTSSHAPLLENKRRMKLLLSEKAEMLDATEGAFSLLEGISTPVGASASGRTQTVFTLCCNARKKTLQNTMGHGRDCVSDERAGTRGQRRSPASGECVRFTRSRPVCRARVGKASESEKSGQRCPDFYLEARVRCPKGTIALPYMYFVL